MLDTHSSTSGPVFDGRASRVMTSITEEIEDKVGERGLDLVQARLATVLRHPTGYYESRVRIDRMHEGVTLHDGDVVYGPWLEGVGERNRSTRFKGYHTFRLTQQQVERESPAIAERVIDLRIGELNT